MISNKGQAIRVGLKDIPVIGRTTQGVRIMRTAEDDIVSSFGFVPKQQVEEDTEAEAPAAEAKSAPKTK
jgi:DNA gyrase subunit A